MSYSRMLYSGYFPGELRGRLTINTSRFLPLRDTDAGATYQTLLYGINNNGVATGIALDANFDGTGVIFNAVLTVVSVLGAVHSRLQSGQ